MNDYSATTILDVVYAVLEGSDRPLSPYEIEAVAVGAGYDVRAREAVDEIEAYLDTYGPGSPFIQVGYRRYWLYFEPPGGAQKRVSPSIHQAVVAALLLIILVLSWLGFSSSPSPQKSAVAASLPVEAASAPAPAQMVNPEQSSIQPPAITIDPDWWSANAVNQLNQDTQAVSRNILSNFYNTCGPAVISMVVTFYRSQPGGEGTRLTTADVLSDAHSQLGFFHPPYNSGLLNFKNLNAIAGLYGFVRANPEGRAYLLSMEDLLQGVRQGYPAIVGIRYGYSNDRFVPVGGSGIYNHFVVIFGTQQVDGHEYLLLLNNHPGKYLVNDADVQPELISLEQFQRSWLLNDGSEDHHYGPAAFFKPAP